MTDLIRKGKGKPLRDAMRRSGLTQVELAAKTKAVDESGKGVSLGTVIKVTGRGKFSADRCRLRTAHGSSPRRSENPSSGTSTCPQFLLTQWKGEPPWRLRPSLSAPRRSAPPDSPPS
jgi:hypothetical protein